MKKLLVSTLALLLMLGVTGCGSSQKEIEVNMFSNCKVEFEGLNGSGKVKEFKCDSEIDGEPNEEQKTLINELEVINDASNELANGDKVTLSLRDLDEQKEKELKDSGIILVNSNLKVDVNGLHQLYADASELKKEAIDVVDKGMTEVLNKNREAIHEDLKQRDELEYNPEDFKLESKLFFKEEGKKYDGTSYVKSNKVIYIYSYMAKTYKEPGFAKNDGVWFDRKNYIYLCLDDYLDSNTIDSDISINTLYTLTLNFDKDSSKEKLESDINQKLNNSLYNTVKYQMQNITEN